jgi:hypothetical protein
MKGLELSRRYYEAFGKEMLENDFGEILPYLAIGLSGSGSECYGFDDEKSQDHDFEPSFCIFLPENDVVDEKTAFRLERAYAKLPKSFMGFDRCPVSPVGGSRHGVIRMDDFFLSKVGSKDGYLSLEQWFSVPEYGLLEATNGEVFSDPFGKFTSIRKQLEYFPEDVRLKKMAGHLLLMGQAGQYNYNRCIARGETAAAQLAVFEFVQSTLHCIYLLNRAYMPYYKWSFRGLRSLSRLNHLSEDLEYLISSDNAEQSAKEKTEIIERLCSAVSKELREQGLSERKDSEMEMQAYAVNDNIRDSVIRTMHILQGV